MQEQVETVGILILKGVVLPVIGIIVMWASLKLPQWVKAKVQNESVAGVLERLMTLAFTVVQEVQQTFVSNLTEPTTEQLAVARDKAVTSLKAYLGPKGIEELKKVLGLDGDTAVERLIITFIESAVHNLKATPKPLSGTLLEAGTISNSDITVNPPADKPADA
jgi:hypothetical protein